MNLVKRLLIIPCIAPLLIVYSIALLNLNKPVRLKLLTFNSPSSSLGLMMILGSSAATIISSLLLLSSPRNIKILKNKISLDSNTPNDINNKFDDSFNQKDTQEINTIYSKRDPRDPSPTISVSYRVIGSISNNYEARDNTEPINSEPEEINYIQMNDYVEQENENNYINNYEEEESELLNSDSKTVNTDIYSPDDWGYSLGENW